MFERIDLRRCVKPGTIIAGLILTSCTLPQPMPIGCAANVITINPEDSAVIFRAEDGSKVIIRNTGNGARLPFIDGGNGNYSITTIPVAGAVFSASFQGERILATWEINNNLTEIARGEISQRGKLIAASCWQD